MSEPAQNSAARSPERVREHYRIERQLADRLRAAGKSERRHLYSAVYDELFRSLPDHPQLTLKTDRATRAAGIAERLALLRRYLRPGSKFLEIGPGDCALAIEVARFVERVYAVEASAEISGVATALPPNMKLIISDSCAVPVADASIDVAYSDQVMEHLHPDDAIEQLGNIYRALAPSGVYICLTPNRISGPHDVSRNFDDVATGLHLKEYTAAELANLFRAAGFAYMQVLVGARGKHIALPVAVLSLAEAILLALPRGFAKLLARSLPFRVFLGLKLVGTKAAAPVSQPAS